MKFFFQKTKSEIITSTLTNEEEFLLSKLNIPAELAIAIKNKTRNKMEGLYELQMFDDYKDKPQLKGIKSVFGEKATLPEMLKHVKELQSDNQFKDYHIFTCGYFGEDKNYFIGAIKTHDQYECLRVFETNGVNYNVETKDIIRFFERWQNRVKFSIIDAYHDRVVIQLSDFNFNIDEFSKEALELCPDFSSVAEDENQLKSYILNSKGEVDFWWD